MNAEFNFQKPGNREETVTIDTRRHDPNNVRVAATIIRHFVYDGKDQISTQELEICQTADIEIMFKDRIDALRKTVNDLLQAKADLVIHAPQTYDFILRTILDGMILHYDKQRADTIARWERDPAMWRMVWHSFEDIMNRLTIAMKILSENNALILKIRLIFASKSHIRSLRSTQNVVLNLNLSRTPNNMHNYKL